MSLAVASMLFQCQIPTRESPYPGVIKCWDKILGRERNRKNVHQLVNQV